MPKRLLKDIGYQMNSDIGGFLAFAGLMLGGVHYALGESMLLFHATLFHLLEYLLVLGGSIYVRTVSNPPVPRWPMLPTLLILPLLLTLPVASAAYKWLCPFVFSA